MSASKSEIREPPHRRRVRGRAIRRWGRGATWLAVAGVAALIGVSGYSVGAFVIGTFATVPNQSSATANPTAPPGVSYVLTEDQIVSSTTVPASGNCVTSNLGNQTSPALLSNGNKTGLCLSISGTGFGTGDNMYIMEISWNTSAAVGTVFQAQIGLGVTPVSHDIVTTAYVKTSATITTSEMAVFAVDLTQSGDSGVTQLSVLITQL